MLFYQLPVNFNITYAVFHLGNLVSTILVTILMVIYQVSNRNRLLRSTCILCFAVSLALFINFCRGDAHIYGGPDCQLQALVLNYFYVSLHAHFCFFMVNSCFAALNWSFLGTKSPEMRTTVFIVASWMIPMLPTIFAIWRFLTDRKPTVLARHFYCAISSPSWPIFRFWFFAFSAPGLFFSFYLLFCTWRYRQMAFRLSKTTQIDKSELFRLFLAIFLYIVLISLSLARSGNSEHARPQYSVPDSRNPFKTPDFCVSCDRKEYFCSRLCPAMKSYLPVLVGCILFAMYGFGAVASKCYKRFGDFLMGRRSTNQNYNDDSRRSSHTTNSQDKRRLSSTSTANNSTYSQIQRQSLPFAIFSNSSGDNSSSPSFSQILHPNLSVIHDPLIHGDPSDGVILKSSQSNHSQNYHRHHPSLPSIDEDLEVLYMNVNSRPVFKRNFHRRFSEPSILQTTLTLNCVKNETQIEEIDNDNESFTEELTEDMSIETENEPVFLFSDWPLGSPHKHNYLYCSAQALGLNYFFISTHAHFSFVMWNNLATAMGWKFLGIKDPTALVGLMFFVSISIPIVPTIIILAMNLDPNSMEKSQTEKMPTFLKKYFFCVVNEPAWWGYRLWFVLFSVPGIIAAAILFWKTLESRRKMLKFSNTSQFSKMQLARMFFALIAYLVLSIMSVILGFTDPKDDDVIRAADFIPASVGFLLFITYGLGNTANEFYKKMYIKLGKKMGIDFNTLRTSISSKSDSVSSPVNRRQSSIISNEKKQRRPSQLSESIDEHFIYDLPNAKNEEPERKPKPKQQPSKRKNIRRGSEPSNRRAEKRKDKSKSIEIIPEVNEDFEEGAE